MIKISAYPSELAFTIVKGPYVLTKRSLSASNVYGDGKKVHKYKAATQKHVSNTELKFGNLLCTFTDVIETTKPLVSVKAYADGVLVRLKRH